MASPLQVFDFPSLVNFADEFVFVIGGTVLNVCCTETEKYCIRTGKWSMGPRLRETRMKNSSCRQGDMIYTFGGYKLLSFKKGHLGRKSEHNS